ncbi:MAG: transglutaminaseTgpA domain-containing protein [Acidimicrobiales bacterium]
MKPRHRSPFAARPRGEELALLGVTAVSAVGLNRLFSDTSFLVPVLAAAVTAHVVAAASRRLALRPAMAALVAVAGLALFSTWAVELGTTASGFPTPGTVAAFGRHLGAAWTDFGRVVAPAAVTPGFVLGAVVLTWVAASVADIFAFRARTRFEALVPSFTLFLFGALLGVERDRLAIALAYLAAVLVFAIVAETTERAESVGRPWALAATPSGLVVAVGALVVAALAGPRLPGVGEPGLVALQQRAGDGGGSRVTVSPLVDIRKRLISQADVELFTVASQAPSYWRLTALDRFDGQVWSSRGSFQAASGGLPAGRATKGPETIVRQDYDLTALSSIWLPAAFRPERLEPVPGVRHDPESASLVSEGPSANGLRYSVESAVPRLTAGALSSVSDSLAPDVASRYLPLPANFPAAVKAQAEQVVGDQAGPYRKARALQDWFRSEFTYSLEVPAGHDTSAIGSFLTSREGYCEQFAGTFAAMARSIGVPARVAVGFVPGSLGADGRYHVRGQDAHAWPEVFLAGYGWAAFEPTPGRGLPGAQDYTGVPVPAPAAADEGPGTAPAPAPNPPEPETTVPSDSEPGPGTDATPPTTAAPTPSPVARAAEGAVKVLALLLLGIVALTGPPLAVVGIRHRRRRRRRAAATTPADHVAAAWAEALEALAADGLPRHGWETTTEYARRAAERLGPAGPALSHLAAAASAATYSAGGVSPEVAEWADRAAATVESTLAADTSLMTRARRAVDPRSLLRDGALSPRA